ncbi:uncharacterized protein [Macrobrachium rosenbergii]|uniref:uncharacterized protein n=1 Tax=Macrobrachium rosenbergii TaxID=79674 RepID=UPI0034D5756C
MSRTSVSHMILQGMKCSYCGKLYVKPRCLQNHVILRHSISISMPPIHKENCYVRGRGAEGQNITGPPVLREIQNYLGSTPPRICPSIEKDASALMCLQPTSSVAVVNSTLLQHQHLNEMERNPILSIDILGLCGEDLLPPDQQQKGNLLADVVNVGILHPSAGHLEGELDQKQEFPSAGPLAGELDQKQESFLEVLDAIDFDEKEKGGEVDDKNIQIAQTSVQLQPQSPPEVSAPVEEVTEDDSHFLENITCIEDLCKFE